MTNRRDGPTGVAGAELEVDAELVKERAEALGRAGRALEGAVTAYRAATATGSVSADEEERLLAHVAANVYRLAVQRECAGARHGNLAAIGAAYDVPAAALRRL